MSHSLQEYTKPKKMGWIYSLCVVIVHRERHLLHRNRITALSKLSPKSALHYQMPFLHDLEDLVNVADVQKSFDQYLSAASELRSIIFPF